MDLNYFLVWFVCVSSLIFLIRGIRSSPRSYRGWIVVSGSILLITLSSWMVIPHFAGWIGGILWAIFVILPLIGFGQVNRLTRKKRYRQARQLALYLRYLHPSDGWLEQPDVLQALEMGQQGNISQAKQILNRYHDRTTPIGRNTKALSYVVDARWSELLTWFKEEIPPELFDKEHNLVAYYLRALGELGDLNGLLEGVKQVEPKLERVNNLITLNLIRMYALAFCGHPQDVEYLFSGSLSTYSQKNRWFWLLTAQMASTSQREIKEKISALKSQNNVPLNNAIDWRLSRSLPDPKKILTPRSQKIISQIKRDIKQEEYYGKIFRSIPIKSYGTYSLILINLVFFTLETFLGGNQNPDTLDFLGALIPLKVWNGEWWRVITANFLHYGYLHLSMNMAGLFFLGSFVELMLGIQRYLCCYFLSGAGTMFIFAWLFSGEGNEQYILVGASAAIMGLIGASTAIFLRGWRQGKSRIARQRFRLFLVIIGLQIIFDSLFPQVSGLSHILGLILGFITGSILQGFTNKKSGL